MSSSSHALLDVALRDDPLVAEHFVEERTALSGERIAVAYVVPAAAIDRRSLVARLPRSKEPFAVVFVARIPRDSRGDVDRAALLALPAQDQAIERALASQVGAFDGVEVVAAGFEESRAVLPRVHVFEVFARNVNAISGASQEDGKTRRLEGADPGAPASAVGESLAVLAGDLLTLGASLVRAASSSSGVLTFVDDDGRSITRTWTELLEASERALRHLRSLHLAEGTAVVIQLDRAEDVLVAFWGAVLGGYVPLIATVLERIAGVFALFGDHRPAVFTDRARAANVRAFSPSAIATIEDARASERERDHHRAHGSDIALYTLSSGSTGTPKCIMLTHEGLLARARGANRALGATRDDVALSFLPFDHIGSISDWHLRVVELGGNAVYASKEYVLGKIARWLELIDRHRVTASWAPNFAYDLLSREISDHPPHALRLSTLRCLLSAGESVSLRTIASITEQLARYGMRRDVLTPAFGMAELGSGITYADRAPDGSLRAHTLDRGGGPVELADLGRPIPGVALRVVGASGAVLTEGELGRVQVRGACVARGYLANAEATRASFFDDGWFDTGDSGALVRGRLVHAGRTKDTIIVQGVNYAEREIEEAAELLEGVEPSFTAACAIHGTPGAIEEELAVFFVPRALDGSSAAEVRSKIARRLGVSPNFVIPVNKDRIPKTEIGKIKRRQLARALERGDFDSEIIAADLALANDRTLPAWFFRKTWARAEGSRAEQGSIYVYDDPSGLGRQVAAVLRARGRHVATELGANVTAIAGAFNAHSLLEVLRPVIGSRSGEAVPPGAASRSQPVASRLRERGAPIHLLAFSTADQRSHASIAAGLLSALVQELAGLSGRALNLERFDPAAVADELELEPGAFDVLRKDGERFAAALEPVRFEKRSPGIFRGGNYLVTGASGGIGAELSNYLEREYRARVIRASRTTKLEAEVERAEKESGRTLDGIFHLAGAYAEREVLAETSDSLGRIIDAKLATANQLKPILSGRPGCRLVVFSSLAAHFGGARLGAHAAANRALEALAEREGDRATSIAWSVWRDLGIGKGAPIDQLRETRGYLPISRDEGLRSLEAILTLGGGRYLVGLDPTHRNTRHLLTEGSVGLERAVVRYRGRELTEDERAQITTRDRFGARVEPIFVKVDHGDEAKLAPRNQTEARIAEIWREVLGVSEIGVEENFFRLGGDSLLATQMVSRVRDAFSIEVPIGTLFEEPTIAGLARLVGGEGSEVDEELAQLIAEVDGLSDGEVAAMLATTKSSTP